ncbi:hypothetical protein S40288_06503 [Stachybotrys chartarum IBT 40288]|nr:hypothetical protein S40288_06503 [Stachybotrys chartarum IBT 40288]
MSIPTAAVEIPRITELRRMIDYDDTSLPRSKILIEDLRTFRKKFTTSKGRRGMDLTNWKDERDKAELLEMTSNYLVRDGNGSLFWPDDPALSNYNKLQWSKSKDLLNKEKNLSFQKVNMAAPRAQRGASKDNPIEVEGHAPARSDDSMSPRAYQRVFRANPVEPFSGVVDPSLRPEPFSIAHHEHGTSEAGSTSQIPSATSNHNDSAQPSSEPIGDVSIGPDSRPTVNSGHEDGPPAKRRKGHHPRSRIVILHTKKSKKHRRQTQNDCLPTWTSPRVRRPRRDSTWATEEQLRDLDSSDSARSSPGQPDTAPEEPAPGPAMLETATLETATAATSDRQPLAAEEHFSDDEDPFAVYDEYIAGMVDTIEGSRPWSSAENVAPEALMVPTVVPAYAPPNPNSAHVDPSLSARPVSREPSLYGSPEPYAAVSSRSTAPVAVGSDVTTTSLPVSRGQSEPLLTRSRGSFTTAAATVSSMTSPVSAVAPPGGSSTPVAVVVSRTTSPVSSAAPPEGSSTPVAVVVSRTTSPTSAAAPPQHAAARAQTAMAQTTLQEERQTELAESSLPVSVPTTHSQVMGPPPPPKVAKPKINFAYYVVLSRVPEYRALQWKPSKRFTEMNLAEFEHEIPHKLPADAKGWLVTLNGPGVHIQVRVHRDEDEEHAIMKSAFGKQVRAAIPQNMDKVHLVFDIEIEVFKEELVRAAGAQASYEDELDF